MLMLILTRKVDQVIVFVGRKIRIVTLDIKPSIVGIGIKAPIDTLILRGELEEKETDEARENGHGGMLVLRRKVDQTIIIGPDVEIKVLGIETYGRKNTARVKLGINAPEDWIILREELIGRPLPEGQSSIGRRL